MRSSDEKGENPLSGEPSFATFHNSNLLGDLVKIMWKCGYVVDIAL